MREVFNPAVHGDTTRESGKKGSQHTETDLETENEVENPLSDWVGHLEKFGPRPPDSSHDMGRSGGSRLEWGRPGRDEGRLG